MTGQLTSLTKPLNLIFILNFYVVSPVWYNACRHIVWLLYVLGEKGLKMKIRKLSMTMGSFSQILPPASWQLALSVVVSTFLSHQGKPSRLPQYFFHCPFELNIACYYWLTQSVSLPVLKLQILQLTSSTDSLKLGNWEKDLKTLHFLLQRETFSTKGILTLDVMGQTYRISLKIKPDQILCFSFRQNSYWEIHDIAFWLRTLGLNSF